MYAAVIFDLDGTLLDTLGDLAQAGNHTLRTLARPEHPVDAYRQMVGNGIPKLVRRMLPVGSDEPTLARALTLFSSYYSAHMDDVTAPYPGVSQLVGRLRQQGTPLAVLSNKPDFYTRQLVQHFFPDCFDAVLGQRDGMPPKPDPASAFELIHTLGLDAARTLYVGDTDVDIQTAQNAGMAGCGVLWGFRDRLELETAGATHIAASPQALYDIVVGQGGADTTLYSNLT